jgi:mono/diheme cytochrome c family protein
LKTVYLSIFLLCLFCTIAAADDRNQDSSLTGNPIYKKNCAKCHGKTAEGRHFGGPSLISEKVSSASVDDLRTIITNGKGRMPKFVGKLSPAEIDLLLMQVKAANQK